MMTHRERHMVNLSSGIELVLLTITEDVSIYIHTTAVTQLPVLLPGGITPANERRYACQDAACS
jgi:hypothetical protein